VLLWRSFIKLEPIKPGGYDMGSYPVHLRGDLSDPPGRWLWLIKWLLLVPHYIILAFLEIAFFVLTVIAFFSILFTGKYPREIFDFNVGVLRWSWRVGFYGIQALGTDRYPPFSLEPAGGYPADLEIEYPEDLSGGLVLIKWWLLVIPQAIIVSVFQGGSNGGIVPLLSLVGALINLFTGEYPKELFDLIVGMDRWSFRVYAYVGLMRDEYPPFRLSD
jgi:hypothetical protein